MIKTVILTNIPSPYRVDFFYYLKSNIKDIDFTIIYSRKTLPNRKWSVDDAKIKGDIILKSFVFSIKTKYDTKCILVARGLQKELEQLKPDVVVVAEYNPNVMQTINWCRKKGIPYISWTDGTLNSEKNINFLQMILRKIVIRNAKAFIASSTKSREAQISYGAREDRIFISFLTVNIEKYLIRQENRKKTQLLFVGDLIKRKGVDLLLYSIKSIELDYTLVIVGDGPERGALEALTEKLNIKEKVVFCGFRENEEIVAIYKQSSFLVLPTREDCFALVLLEAMSSGLAVISSQYADGAYDLIEPGINGYIVDPYNYDEMREKIVYFLMNTDVCEKMGKNATSLCGKFSFEQVSEGYVAAIRYALGR